MKKTLKKLMIIMIIIMIIFNATILSNSRVYATGSTTTGVDSNVQDDEDGNIVEDLLKGLLESVVGLLSLVFRIPAMAFAWAINKVTAAVAYAEGTTFDAGSIDTGTITPFEIFFNKIQLIDINFLDFNHLPTDSVVYKIRESVSMWYYIMRIIALSILLLILIYVGIKIAITTIASEKAIYKKALTDWVVSLVILFMIQLIVLFTINVNNALIKALENAATSQSAGVSAAMTGIFKKGLIGISIEGIACTVIYCIMVGQTLGFLISYINRMIKLAFLIIISPLITITYTIDRMGDGKAQALNAWLKEFVFSVLIQPFHCIIYIVLIDMAFNLLGNGGMTLIGGGTNSALIASVLAILCIKFVKEAEKIVRKIFHFEDDDSSTSLAAGLAIGAVALNKAKGVGRGARVGFNAIRHNGLVKAVTSDAGKLKNNAQAALMARSKNMKDNQGNVVDGNFSERYTAAKAIMQEEKQQKEERKIQEAAEQIYKAPYKNTIMKRAKEIKKNHPGMTSAEALNQAKQEVRQAATNKINSSKGNVVTRKLRSARGVVNKASRKLNQSETFKWMKKNVKETVIPGGLALATGSMLMADKNAFTAIAGGYAAFGAGREFMTTTTGTITSEVMSHAELLYRNRNEASQGIEQIKGNGDAGMYADEKVFYEYIDAIETALKALGMGDKAAQVRGTIMNGVANIDQVPFDLQDSLKQILGSDVDKDTNIYRVCDSFQRFQHESHIYKGLQTADDVGLPYDDMKAKLLNRMEGLYSAENTESVRPVETVTETDWEEEIVNAIDSIDEEKVEKIQNIIKDSTRVEYTKETFHTYDVESCREIKKEMENHLEKLKNRSRNTASNELIKRLQGNINVLKNVINDKNSDNP